MPMYYFHIRSSDTLVDDLEGSELADVAKAYDEAAEAARELLAESVRKGDVIDDHEFELCDEHGTEVFTIPFVKLLRFPSREDRHETQ
jgi:hypothetical protein